MKVNREHHKIKKVSDTAVFFLHRTRVPVQQRNKIHWSFRGKWENKVTKIRVQPSQWLQFLNYKNLKTIRIKEVHYKFIASNVYKELKAASGWLTFNIALPLNLHPFRSCSNMETLIEWTWNIFKETRSSSNERREVRESLHYHLWTSEDEKKINKMGEENYTHGQKTFIHVSKQNAKKKQPCFFTEAAIDWLASAWMSVTS